MPAETVDLLQQLVSQQLGAPPAAAAGPGAQGAAPGAPAAAPKADPSPTDIEKAQTQLAPKADGGKDGDESVKFIKLGDNEFTEDQLKGTMSRYRDLNYKWQTEVAPNKAVLEVMKQLAEAAKKNGVEPKGDELAQYVAAAVKAYSKNPQMGGDGNQRANDGGQNKNGAHAAMSGDEDTDKMFSDWERENAVKLPPGFRETIQSNKQMSGQMQQLMAMVQQLAQGGAGGQQAQAQAQQAVQQAQTRDVTSMQRMIGTNLTGAFNAAGLPIDDQTRADFRLFAAQRGYDLGDFLDPELSATVVNDYKANKDAPEINRLREVAKKRAAFTGNVEGAPGSSGAAAAAAGGGDPMFTQLAGAAMTKRGM